MFYSAVHIRRFSEGHTYPRHSLLGTHLQWRLCQEDTQPLASILMRSLDSATLRLTGSKVTLFTKRDWKDFFRLGPLVTLRSCLAGNGQKICRESFNKGLAPVFQFVPSSVITNPQQPVQGLGESKAQWRGISSVCSQSRVD